MGFTKSSGVLLVALALVASAARSNAQSATFNFTGSIVTYEITISGIYEITADGAQGGGSQMGSTGGDGAIASGSIFLASGTTLDIVVGGTGASGAHFDVAGGGGGGSFVYTSVGTLLLAAGGGGGNGDSDDSGGIGLSVTSGQSGGGADGGAGGSSGSGGSGGSNASSFNGGGGAGFLSSGSDGAGGTDAFSGLGGASTPTFAGGGAGFIVANNSGGFGGGGGGGQNGGGGGGGYSGGGGGGGNSADASEGGGGGASYATDLSGVTITAGGNTAANGLVTLTLESVPEPSTYALLGFGALVLFVSNVRKKSKDRI